MFLSIAVMFLLLYNVDMQNINREEKMPEIIIYTTQTCPYCIHAKTLLNSKGITDITEIDVSGNEDLRAEMMKKAGGRRTVPQIFIGGTHVGGFDDMNALDKQGKLDALLKKA
jgi:glutaredoxin 3